MKYLLLALLLPTFALADITEQEASNRKTSAQKAATKADSELPPCEGHDHLHETVSKFSPPSSCPKAKEAFDFMLSMSNDIRRNCRDFSHWIEPRLRSPKYCASDSDRNSVLTTLGAFKKKNDKEEPARISQILEDSVYVGLNEGKLKSAPAGSEWARLECRNPVMLAEQLRSRQNSLANKHYGLANTALEDVCEEGPKGAEDYFKFLKGGEKAL